MSRIKTVLEVQRLESDTAKSNDVLLEYTPVHFHTLLKYIRINPDFLKSPLSFPRTLTFISNDLTRNGLHKSSEEVHAALEHWKERLSDSDEASLTRPLDRELKRLLESVESRLTHAQITLILQHMEVVGSKSQTLWPTIGVEMKALKFSHRPDIYWRRSFERWCQEARKRYEKDPDGLSSLQQRYIDFLRERNELNQTEEENVIDVLELFLNQCRTCLETLKASNARVYLFEAMGTGTTLADKINMCFGSGIDIEERLPKYVCGECVKKVEVAYTLKMQIDRADEDLRSLLTEYSRKSYNTQEEAEEKLDVLDGAEQPVGSVAMNSDHSPADENTYIDFECVPNDLIEECYDINMDGNEQESDSRSSDNEEKTEFVTENAYCSETHEETTKPIKEEEEDIKFSLSILGQTDDSSDGVVKQRKKSRNKIVPEIDKEFYRCNQCRTILRTRELWQAHMARHASEKQHVCSMCSKEFRSASTLKVHLRTHTNERPYVCDVCGKAFRTYSQIKAHGHIHRPDDRPVKCEHCPYTTSTRSSLIIHLRSHVATKPYICAICKAGFGTSSNMHKHIRSMHEKLKPFKCEECGKTFTTKETVQKHMVTHNGTKPYSCPECNVPYSWYNGLQKHMKLIHPGSHIPTEKTLIDAYNDKHK